ncbi:response regulator [Paenibacillus hemerocallicola]|uniref:Response regulator n=1 Tax=Paenibacillus hemerocallicola TaxID=1172614 RepID=A0A5C4T4P6_9BACL|nr:response regulator [Paenibacillus hemerocallicola]TNJ64014.1 response regulator [Paenibacillus hemerocallicola]
MLRAIIVDDEELSVKRLKSLLSESGEIGACPAFLDPWEAYEFVKANPIDVAFLDISMPEINGMELSGLLQALDDSIHIVFVTGHDEYAVQAFDKSALDYLLKPVTAERLSNTLGRIGKKRRNAVVEPSLTVLLFNGLKIYGQERDNKPLKLRSPKTEELFAFLVCKGAVSREEIIDTLWSGLETDKALKNLNSTLYYIRKALSTSKIDNCILAGRHEIAIDESGVWCDLYEFERLLKQVRLAPEHNAELFKQAEVLYTGELLKGKAYEWASEKTRQLERHYIELLEAAARFHIEMNEPQQSLYYFCEILKLDAIREDIHHEAIRLYAELGRKNEAFRQYRMLEDVLEKELGTKPDSRITRFITKMGE